MWVVCWPIDRYCIRRSMLWIDNFCGFWTRLVQGLEISFLEVTGLGMPCTKGAGYE